MFDFQRVILTISSLPARDLQLFSHSLRFDNKASFPKSSNLCSHIILIYDFFSVYAKYSFCSTQYLLSCYQIRSLHSNSLFHNRIENVFRLIFIILALELYILYCLLNNNILVSELFYNIMSIVTQNKLYMKYFITKLVIYFLYNLALQSQLSILLLFF